MEGSGLQSGSSRGDATAGPPGAPVAAGLPVVGAPPGERADAVRNRRRVLEAAAQLHAARGVAGLTMDDVAAAAGVGKGTVYRRFRDKSGLAAALLDDRGRELQERLLHGPPPLGPGAGPADRLAAFVVAYVDHVVRSLDLVLLSETASPGGRLDRPVYGFWRRHAEVLLAEAGAPQPRLRAEALLAMLAAEQLRQWTVVDGRAAGALAADLADAALGLARGPGPGRRRATSAMTLRFEIFPADLDAAVEFYTRVLAFRLVRDERDRPYPYVALERGGVRVGAAGRAAVDRADLRRPPTGVELVLEVDDVTAERDRVRASGWPLDEDLQARPWGLTDFRVLDPDGYLLRVTSRD